MQQTSEFRSRLRVLRLASGDGTVKLWFAAVLVISALALAACGGSSSPPHPPAGGFTNASLSGQYAFAMSGLDDTGAYTARIGSFTADGAGNISAGVQDVLDLSSGQPASVIPFTSGSYGVQANGQAQVLLEFSGGTLQLSLAMQSPSNGYAIETDLSATTSGTFHLQTASDFSISALNSQYVFKLSGVTFVPSAAAPISLIGEFAANGGGTISGGVMDTYNGNTTPSGATAIAPGSYAIDSSKAAFGRGAMSFSGYTFAFYIIDSTHIVVLEEDTLGGSSGDAFMQSSPAPTVDSQFNGSFVFMIGGYALPEPKGPVARVARFTADGNGGLASISLDDNNNGRYTHISQGSNISNATYSIDPTYPGSGRGTLTFTDSSAGTFDNIFYVISPTQAVVQTASAGILGDGPLTAQSGTSFALGGAVGNLVFNWTGIQLGANTAIPLSENYIGQYALTNVASSNIAGTTDYVSLGLSGTSLSTNVALGGTLTINGAGTNNNLYKFAVNGSPSVTINFQAYFVDNSTLYLVCSDSNRTTLGIISQQ
jgi:hypothetical protein